MHLNEQSRLLITNEEKVLYVGSLHPMYGIKWMIFSVACFALATAITGLVWMDGRDLLRPYPLIPLALLLITGFACWVTYSMPFWRSFFVITDDRAIIGFGQFTIKEEQILPHQMEDWEIQENYFETLLGYGHVTLRMLEGRQIRTLHIPYLRQPHLFTRFLDEISPIRARVKEETFDGPDNPPTRQQLNQSPPQNRTSSHQQGQQPPAP